MPNCQWCKLAEELNESYRKCRTSWGDNSFNYRGFCIISFYSEYKEMCKEYHNYYGVYSQLYYD